MALTPSNDLPLGTPAPAFSLPDVAGKTHTLADFSGPILVVFICNHCPFVKHLKKEFAQFAREYTAKGLGVIAICSNDEKEYPEDSLANMGKDAKTFGYVFPYIQDRSQSVARAYRAACTPDFFLYDRDHKLFYHGQFDDSRPNNGKPVTGADLRAAADAVLKGDQPPAKQTPSIGCNIKWMAGNPL